MTTKLSVISKDEADLTPEEREQKNILVSIANTKPNDYEKLFSKLDISNNGEITLQEFKKALLRMDHPVKENEELVKRIFTSLDTNNDNKVDFNDFKLYLTVTDDQILQGFKKIDQDNDGKLNKQDFAHYLNKKLHLSPTTESVDTIFNQIDTKHDGFVTFDEFRDFLLLMPRLDGSRIKTAFQYIVEELDISSDGDVTVINQFLNGFGYFLAGGISGVVSRTCTAPFDRIKVFLIARTDLASTVLTPRKVIEERISHRTVIEEAKKAEAHLHHKTIRSPIIQAARTIWKQGGFKGFYVGNGLNIFKVFPESAMKFGTFEFTKRLLATVEGVEDTKDLSKVSTYLAGGLGGVVAQFTVYPIDTLKFRLQCSNIDANVSLFNTAKDLFREGGLRIFYRGIFVGVAGIFPYAALDLGTFTTIKKWLVKRQMTKYGIKHEEDVKLPNYMVLGLGALSGSFGATMVYPVNLLRTRLQAQGTYAHPYRYDGFRDVLQKTIQNEGYPGLFKGLVPNLAKVAPAVAISYFMYENLKNIFELETNK
ncbi:hypothetical protein PSN45_001304 [Yamadazyma tenuis]|uniref:Mitochondrial thiamine pyrophosphate carrier 1 n=1 Tax=Candida tenuis (strain ATCC 10573 / BCRC 21748 / CBS 615 / JCM 9827 / NBRC 10315 / NRRL Y-1498 / VKM Y-70) TaxID=590646 RepID=G3BD26_CANTC|nr:uncharacterized protein CANTEDRAFT_110026 [Yamadazyma tenuis ATCC 10573]EGV60902.1 hypothetical protein CANTEDRAFT_110026 [Yamadazyma tenuis ATCC 10573]WEJ93828.1 hypothetical protein PSN45_001304 [Yamadazyma tenuis]